MREMGRRGAVGGRIERTKVSDKATSCPRGPVKRDFGAERPDRLRVADLTPGNRARPLFADP